MPGAEDQTALSLEECLRLLEATFPFGDNNEVSPQQQQRPEALDGISGASTQQQIGFGCSRRLQEAPGILRNHPGRGGCD